MYACMLVCLSVYTYICTYIYVIEWQMYSHWAALSIIEWQMYVHWALVSVIEWQMYGLVQAIALRMDTLVPHLACLIHVTSLCDAKFIH